MASVFQVCDRTRLSGEISPCCYTCAAGCAVTARATKVTAIPKKSGCDEFNCLWDTNDTLLYSSLLFLGSGRSGWRCELRSQLRFIRKPALISPLFFSFLESDESLCRIGFNRRVISGFSIFVAWALSNAPKMQFRRLKAYKYLCQ